jgi:hypothetical protein
MDKRDLSKTVYLFIDTEFYIPASQRNNSEWSLIVNPYMDENKLLGGSFVRWIPSKGPKEKLGQFWIWQDGMDEKLLLNRFYGYFKNLWKTAKDEFGKVDLTMIGIGVERFDIPAIFARSVVLKIDSTENLFNVYHKCRFVDLSEVGIPFFDREYIRALYPKGTNALMKRWNVDAPKDSGVNVSEMFDKQDYAGIEQRNNKEVLNIVKIYDQIVLSINRMAEYKMKNQR